MRLVWAGIGGLLVCLVALGFSISSYARSKGSTSIRAVTPIVARESPPAPAERAQAVSEPAAVPVISSNQGAAPEAAATEAPAPPPPPVAPNPQVRVEPLRAAPAEHGAAPAEHGGNGGDSDKQDGDGGD